MIITRTPEGLMVVRHPDHGTQTGLIATSWGNDEIPPLVQHKRSLRIAAAHHDDGWATWERRPTLDPGTGLPFHFDLGPKEHIPLYRAGILRAAQYDPRAGLLISMHGAGLYNDRYGTFRLIDQKFNQEETQLVIEFLADMEKLQSALAGRTPRRGGQHVSSDPAVRYEYLLLQVWDRLSLQYVYRDAKDGVISPLPVAGDVQREILCRNAGHYIMTLDPYPFAEDHSIFPVTSTIIPDRKYRSPEEFLDTLSQSTPRVLECVAYRAPR